MNKRQWRELIERATADANGELLDSLAEQLFNCETANSFLRSKGYGSQGQTIDATVRLLPNAREWR